MNETTKENKFQRTLRLMNQAGNEVVSGKGIIWKELTLEELDAGSSSDRAVFLAMIDVVELALKEQREAIARWLDVELGSAYSEFKLPEAIRTGKYDE